MNRAHKLTADFTTEERRVIRDRARYQCREELARVFGTTPRVIGNILRYA